MLSRKDVTIYRVFIVHSHQVPYDALFHIPYHIRGKALLCEGVAYRSLIVCQGTLPCRFMAFTSSCFAKIWRLPMPVYRLITGLNVVFVVRMPPLARASSLILSACSEAVSRRNARKTDALVQPTSLTISSTVPRGQTMHLMVFFCISKELFWLLAIFFITCQVKPKMILIA